MKENSLNKAVDEFLEANEDFIGPQVGPLVAQLVHLASTAQHRAEDNQITSAQAAGEFRQTFKALRDYVDAERERQRMAKIEAELASTVDPDEALLGAYE
ncbi:hypothetical protein BH92_15355 [Rhodococcoides fascians A21d2]|uniref:hypothetical protein n=1 Tax=Rhodococcoides fascians TaxID=1828 RepID=UPI0012D358E0|nr:hypothetical protein [Rhodococcus fascians]QII01066.1 hypothetical protein BH92_15355 [Rhodococcus fascians A21d2]